MDRPNRPRSREKRVTGGGKGVYRRGSGLGSGGPVGNAGGYGNRGTGGHGSGMPGGGRGTGILVLLALVVFLFFGGGSFLGGGLFSGGEASFDGGLPGSSENGGSANQGNGGLNGWGSAGSANDRDANALLNTEVAAGSREKRTIIKGNGEDIVTVMVYLCGTDLESKNGMATSDIREMIDADLSDKVNVLLYTGGCTSWRNQVISSRKNQIYQVRDGGLVCLVEDAGDGSMTSPDTLSEFIRWCGENFPANRNELILWDHGGGSVSGYGYDEKYPQTGSMTLSGIDKALKDGGISFDFIGFDACLMATMENGLMLSQYGDYMIASEETEPGYGWYYTDWLTKLSRNTAMPTLEIGKQIADDFVRVCAQKGQGDKTTLSVVDLAELETTAPEVFREFSRSTRELIQNGGYRTVSNARSAAKEFARSSGIDQVDLVHLAKNMGTEEGRSLAEVLKSAVKYNRTSSRIANAYGLSIYFPYKKLSSVDRMVDTYEVIGMEEEYSRCIQQFASQEVAGQAAAGGSGSPLGTLLESGFPSGSNAGSGTGNGGIGQDIVTQLLGSLMSGGYSGITGLNGSNTGFLSALNPGDLENAAGYAAANQLDAEKLVWELKNGSQILHLEEDQWSLVQNLELNVFVDDGEGYIDLGLDTVFELDDEGNLVGDYDRTWLAINGQPVAYYFLEDMEEGEHYAITGRVPAMLNGERVDLILVFDDENSYGYVAGARTDYEEDETETVAKGLTEIKAGDQLDFLCDYYSYDGSFQDSYYLGETMTVGENLEISNVDVGDRKVLATYRLTDIYNRQYWTPPVE